MFRQWSVVFIILDTSVLHRELTTAASLYGTLAQPQSVGRQTAVWESSQQTGHPPRKDSRKMTNRDVTISKSHGTVTPG